MNSLWAEAPEDATSVQIRNFTTIQIEAIGIGVLIAADPFLPVFLTRFGATNFQVGLLTAMPAITGLFLAIVMGRFLAGRRNIMPWFGITRLLIASAYTLTGLAPFCVPKEHVVQAVLLIWAVATIPQTMIGIVFNVVMNAIAGPQGRYDLMSRRWSILGLTTAIMVAVAGQVLDRVHFPLNYQLVFIVFSLGGLFSYYQLTHVRLPDTEPPPRAADSNQALPQRMQGFVRLVRSEPAFLSFMTKRFVYMAGSMLAAPLFPLYFVREVHASNAWIGLINTAQTATLLVGYYFWARQGKLRGSRSVLLWTTLGMTFYPALTAATRQVACIALYAGLSGMFQAGLDLVFFDELMRTIPAQYSTTFVSLAQSVQYLPTVAAPLLGTLLADRIGIGSALFVSAALRLLGFALFALPFQAERE